MTKIVRSGKTWSWGSRSHQSAPTYWAIDGVSRKRRHDGRSNNQDNHRQADAGHWRVTLNHPPINTIDDLMYDEFYDLVEQIEAEPSLKVVTFESANPDFSWPTTA